MSSTPGVRSCHLFIQLTTRSSPAFPQPGTFTLPASPPRTAEPSMPDNSLVGTTSSQPATPNSSPPQEGHQWVLVGGILCKFRAHNGTYRPVSQQATPQQAAYADLENAYLALNLRHQELLLEIELRHGVLGERLLECMRLMHELSLLQQEHDNIQHQQDAIARTADQSGRPFDPYDIHFRPLDLVSHPSGLSSRRRLPRATPRDLLVRQLGQAFYREPSLSSNSFNGAWQSVSSS